MEEWRRRKGGEGSREKLRRKSEVSAVKCLSRREIGIRSRSGTETEENPGKMVKPISSGCPSTEGGLEAAVKGLNKTIGLRMVGSGGLMSDVEEAAKVKPKSRCELRTTVRSDNGRHAKP